MVFGTVSISQTSHSGLTSPGNCEPRLPAAHFLVKKDGPNKGKWFYTCQEPKESGCGFFLWDDNAVAREMRAVIDNTNSEPDNLRTAADASRDARATVASPPSNKWIHNLGKPKDDEFGDWPLSEEEETQAIQTTSRSIPGAYPTTPRKAAKTDLFLTPGSKRKLGNDYLPTPSTTSRGDDVFSTPSTARNARWDGKAPFALRSPSVTPTPSRYRAASTVPESSHDHDITDEVMALLKDQSIDDDTSASLRALLNRHAARVSGIVKGRDITRVALKAKDGKIAELMQKVNTLEREREMDRAVVRELRAESRGGGGT